MIPVRLRAPVRTAGRSGEPVTFGVPLPRGLVPDGWRLAARRPDGLQLPAESVVTDRWSDGSARWVLMHIRLDVPDGTVPGAVVAELTPLTAVASTEPIAEHHDATVRVRTGQATLKVAVGSPLGFTATWHGQLLTAWTRVRQHGGAIAASIDRVEIRHASALRGDVLFHGRVTLRSRQQLAIDGAVECFAGLDAVRVRLTLRNPDRARHEHGFWPLGDPGSVLIDAFELGLSLSPAVTSSDLSCGEDGFISLGRPALLHQDSSGGRQWDSPVHRNRDGLVKARFCGFQLRTPGGVSEGRRAVPVVRVRTGISELNIAVPRFWQNWPQSIHIDDEQIVLGFLSGEHADRHELQGGEQKTYEAVVGFGADAVSQSPLAWAHQPLVVSPDPSWYVESGAVARLSPAAEEPAAGYGTLVNRAIQGESSFFGKRERIDEYGWRHFGDLYADHEAVGHEGPSPLVSHYNNQYDAILAFGVHFLRSGDPRWWELFDDLARHVADIDIYHTNRDKSAYSGGLFWHSNHYMDAGVATHRTYDPAGGVGGGPSAEHNYAAGLALHYFLTGSAASRDAAIGLACWVIRMDEGQRTVFRWLASGPTGLASASGSALYHGPGRASGNSIVACLHGHRLSGDRRLLEKAEELIRRCIHPSDDVRARELFQVEQRWYYTVFLQALGEYLDYKRDLGEDDRISAWARESLLTYARWMASHERPYLSVPELLEFPNETWAAQDMRKAEALAYAACHARGDERTALRKRAEYFYRYSCSTLLDTPNAALTRPLVLALVNGWKGASLLHGAAIDPGPASAGDWQFEPPQAFEPQKTRALRRAKWVVVALASSAAVAALLWL